MLPRLGTGDRGDFVPVITGGGMPIRLDNLSCFSVLHV